MTVSVFVTSEMDHLQTHSVSREKTNTHSLSARKGLIGFLEINHKTRNIRKLNQPERVSAKHAIGVLVDYYRAAGFFFGGEDI